MKVNCEHISKIVLGTHFGELPPEQRELISRHINNCQHCRQELSIIRDIEGCLKAAFEEQTAWAQIPENTLENIKQQAALETQSAPKRHLLAKKFSRFGFLNRRQILTPALAVSILVISLFAMHLINRSNNGITAYEIALNDPQLQSVLTSNSLMEPDKSKVTVINYLDTHGKPQALVAFHADPNFLVVADVDMSANTLNRLNTLVLDSQMSKEVIGVAGNDSRIQALLEQGAIISNLYPAYVFYEKEMVNPDGKVYKQASFDFIIQLRIVINSSRYMAIYDVNTNQITTVVTDSK
ncbi:MAG: zf-HC2 domain-containing protein [Dehalococcoidales bacterium]|nr:zf-HC2 domain-containing protein [Dehalococcoidales bacterium]MDX9986186.1 zf-HC2 domain-containing protein [Dehalococcoidales bacterium]